MSKVGFKAGFARWLHSEFMYRDGCGYHDMAYDICRDSEFPVNKSYKDQRNYLLSVGGNVYSAIEIFDALYHLYRCKYHLA